RVFFQKDPCIRSQNCSAAVFPTFVPIYELNDKTLFHCFSISPRLSIGYGHLFSASLMEPCLSMDSSRNLRLLPNTGCPSISIQSFERISITSLLYHYPLWINCITTVKK